MIWILADEGRQSSSRHPLAHEGNFEQQRNTNKRNDVGVAQALPYDQLVEICLLEDKCAARGRDSHTAHLLRCLHLDAMNSEGFHGHLTPGKSSRPDI
jgi:hypothetical protein